MTDDDVVKLEIRLLLEAIHLRYHYDFRRYAPPTVRRRVEQAVERLGCRSVTHLQERVLREPETMRRLLSLLTIQVSEMFRDPPLFLAARQQIVPYLATYPNVRVWVAGCGNGEEAWSFAILLREEGLLERCLVYATDINPEALRHAESGIFPLESLATFSASYLAAGGRGSLSDHYTAAYGAAAFDRTLRKHLVFSDHSLATDGVFAEVQLVSCRNVLIYFDRSLQDHAVGLFRDALSHRGFLCLGARESLAFGAHADAFEEFDPELRIYRRK